MLVGFKKKEKNSLARKRSEQQRFFFLMIGIGVKKKRFYAMF